MLVRLDRSSTGCGPLLLLPPAPDLPPRLPPHSALRRPSSCPQHRFRKTATGAGPPLLMHSADVAAPQGSPSPPPSCPSPPPFAAPTRSGSTGLRDWQSLLASIPPPPTGRLDICLVVSDTPDGALSGGDEHGMPRVSTVVTWLQQVYSCFETGADARVGLPGPRGALLEPGGKAMHPNTRVLLLVTGEDSDALGVAVNQARSQAGLAPLQVMKLASEEGGVVEGKQEQFGVVVVGGTFDRLHAGHKVLLAAAAYVVRPGGRLVVGVTTPKLLNSKQLKELVEPYDRRVGRVHDFLCSIVPGGGGANGHDSLPFTLEVVPLSEPDHARQPTASDPTAACLVVSPETQRGARAINEARAERGLPHLHVLCIDLVTAGGGVPLSSTQLRQALLGTPLATTTPRKRNCTPYVIGLTGGIASGKSTVREMLKEGGGGGVEFVDCDLLGHRSYEVGTPTYEKLREAFGGGVVKPDGGGIDRAALGARVFADPGQMGVLTGIVWPAIGALLTEECEWAAQRGVGCVVAEAAVLLEAGWQRQVDEVWLVFVSEEEARARLMTRNKLSQQQAAQRLAAQMSVQERLAHADVTISNTGQLADTKAQVVKAWGLLQERMAARQVALGGPSEWGGSQHPMWLRWGGLSQRLGVSDELAQRWWGELWGLFAQPWRHYHTLDHVAALYGLFHRFAHFIAEPAVVQLAIFFHDAIYDPKEQTPGGNEQRSAALFELFASEAGLPEEVAARVRDLILRTANHLEEDGETTGDLAWFLDFDLAVLGSPAEEYKAYAAAVRKEYAHVPTVVFCEKRAAFLKQLLGHRQLYRKSAMRVEFEERARENAAREILDLEELASSSD